MEFLLPILKEVWVFGMKTRTPTPEELKRYIEIKKWREEHLGQNITTNWPTIKFEIDFEKKYGKKYETL